MKYIRSRTWYLFLLSVLIAGHLNLHAANLPPGFVQVLVAQNLDPTAMALTPDGRLFITEKNGRILIVENGQLLSDPLFVLEVDNYNERGLSGVAIDPDFLQNGYLYLYYTVKDANHNRVSRFTTSGNHIVPGSEYVLLDLDSLNGNIHNAGAMAFGIDDKLYISVGDGANGVAPQELNSLLGKILRINADGSIPEDNPFYFEAKGVYRAIYALGLRNSFSLAIQPGTGRIFASDVGAGSWEEVNEILPGRNYGWAQIEGPVGMQEPPENYQDPFFAYTRTHGCAIVGAAFYNPENLLFPAVYHGKFLFADYCHGYIRYLNPDTQGPAVTFATNINRPLNILVAPDGTLYYLARAGIGGGSEEDNTAATNGTLWRVIYTGSGIPFVSVNPQSILVSQGEDARFYTAVSGTQPLFYQWQRNGIDIPGAQTAELIYPEAMLADSGSLFRCIVRNVNGADTSLAAELRVTSSQRPEPEILTPIAGTMYRGGEILLFSGLALDNEQGVLEPQDLRWRIDFHHDTHTHPGLPPTAGITGGAFYIPQTGETASSVWYKIHLTATDTSGLSKTVSREIHPLKTQFHVRSEPNGLPVYVESDYLETPVTVTSVVGIARRTEVLPSLLQGDSMLVFDKWSDGVMETARTFAAEEDTVTYTALYRKYPLGTGRGIRGYFYDGLPFDPTFTEPYLFDRIDTTINFDWGESSPSPELLGDDFWLVRWEGSVQPIVDGTYDFHIIADDGVRLWIDSQLIIDAWIPQPPTEWTGSIPLLGGYQYPIKVEFFEEGGGALCRLYWSSSRLTKSIVPKRQLYTSPTTAVLPNHHLNVRLFPNPAYDLLNLEFDGQLQWTRDIFIYNSIGQRIAQHFIPGAQDRIQIDVSDLIPGIYWMQYRTERGELMLFYFVKS